MLQYSSIISLVPFDSLCYIIQPFSEKKHKQFTASAACIFMLDLNTLWYLTREMHSNGNNRQENMNCVAISWDVLRMRLHNTVVNSLRPRQMDAISQTTFSNAFSWMKMFEFRLKFHWSLFPMVQLTIFQHWFRLWLGAVQATSHYLNQRWLVYRRIYASLGLNELNYEKEQTMI